MAEHTGPGALGSTQGAAGTANNSTQKDGIVGRVREQATAQLTTQKDKATDGLGTVAEAVRQTTQTLRDGQHDTVARYVEQAADQIERFSQQLKNKDVGQLMNDAQQLARRQPALFIGGAFAIGLLGARFLKSSARDDERDWRNAGDVAVRGYGSGPTSSGATSTSNAYGNRVPTSTGTASRGTRPGAVTGDRDYKSTEGL
ncbi:MAG: hypothetical protein H0W08_02855 [Acidobacteria bacterium]|nr:hypothetical protein [Acidobacteriota bacterium]